MTSKEALTYRNILHSVAYNIVGCSVVAEDLVQDTFLNWFKVERKNVVNGKAYLVTSIRNMSFNHLKKKRDELFENMTPHIQAIKESTDFSYMDIKQELKDSLSIIFKKLPPTERAVFLLKEVFNFDYADLPEIIGKTADNCRQLFSRAQLKLKEERERFTIDSYKLSSVVSIFNRASLGELGELIDKLKEDISSYAKSKSCIY